MSTQKSSRGRSAGGKRSPAGRTPARFGREVVFRTETVTIKQTQFVNAPPKTVYNAFLDPRIHSAITGSKATVERREGGTCTAADGYIVGKYLRLQSGRRILQEWRTAEWPAQAPPSLVELRFNPVGDGTEVVMVQSQVPASQAPKYRRGWKEHYWGPLKKFFPEGG